MKEGIKNTVILEKTVRPENGKTLKQVQGDMIVQNDMGVQDDMKVYGHCERMRSNPANYFARSAEKNLSLFTSHLSRKFAFTLAEVLITLGIIGVVAAMTMPSLIQKYQEKVTVNKLKKMYSVLNQAYTLYKVDNVVDDEFETSRDGAIKVFEMFQKHLKVSKICTGAKGCISEGAYSHQNGNAGYGGYGTDTYYNVRLADGSALTFRGGSAKTLFQIYYDVNGELPPNKWGTDFFQFNGLKDKSKIIPCCGEDVPNLKNDCYNAAGWGCTEWVVYNGNMDYLHCPEKLGWDKQYSCKK